MANVVTEAQGAAFDASDSFNDASGPFGYRAEEQGQNRQFRSQEFDNVAWSATKVVIDSGVGRSPAGAAYRLNVDTDSGTHQIQDQLTITSGGTTQVSWLVKDDGGRYIYIKIYSSTNNWAGVTYDLQAGVVTQESEGAAAGTVNSSSMELIADGWYWCRANMTMPADTSVVNTIEGSDSGTPTLNTDGEIIYTPGAGEDYLLGAVQSEDNVTFASSYIPVLGDVAVTRNADVLTYASAGNILDAAGTGFCNVKTDWSAAGRGDNNAYLSRDGNGRIAYSGAADASTKVLSFDGTNNSINTGNGDVSAGASLATTWGTDLIMYVDGTGVAAGAYDGTMGTGDIAIGARNTGASSLAGTIRFVQFYSRELNSSQVGALPR